MRKKNIHIGKYKMSLFVQSNLKSVHLNALLNKNKLYKTKQSEG